MSLTLVTGGSRGIGHFLVQSLLEDGDVLNVSRTPARTDPGPPGHVLHSLSLDLQHVESIEPALNAWFVDHPGSVVTTVVHNAATLNLGRLDEISLAEIERAFRVNVYAPIAITAALDRAGRLCRSGARVVYVVSSLARHRTDLSFAGLGLYSATKAALSRLALIQSREFELLAPHVKVLRIHPGVVDTDMQRRLRQSHRVDPAFGAKTARLSPYQDGEWDERSPTEHMRTISAGFAAEFILWAIRSPVVSSEEYDFYEAEEFHAARSPSGIA